MNGATRLEDARTGWDRPVPATMRAVRVTGWSGDLSRPPRLALDVVPTPRPGPGEALLAMDASAVTHLDLTVATGTFAVVPDLPYVGGVEGAGTVVHAPTVAPGTRAAVKGGGAGLTRPGTWAEYVVVGEESLIPLPADLPDALAGSFLTPAATAQAALSDVARLGDWPRGGARSARDETVVVTGAGGAVGSMAVQLALAAGAEVVALVGSPERAAAVPDGADVVVATDAARTARLARERPASLLVDTIGGPGLLDRARWVRPGGRAVVVGYLAGTRVEVDLPGWLAADVALLPVSMIDAGHLLRAYAGPLAQRLVAGELVLRTRSFPLAEADRAVEGLRASGGGRVVLVP